jgi:hypothetical protein
MALSDVPLERQNVVGCVDRLEWRLKWRLFKTSGTILTLNRIRFRRQCSVHMSSEGHTELTSDSRGCLPPIKQRVDAVIRDMLAR